MRTLLLSLIAVASFGATFRLYLNDGGHHLIREYRVEEDRVHYYSTERSDWEEIPVSLVDLKKTEAEREERDATRAKNEADQEAEDKAERALRREIRTIPEDAGVYQIVDGAARALTQAEVKIVTDKKRSILKTVTPLPIVTGKATVEIDGEHAAMVIKAARPEFYIRQSAEERMAIIRVTPRKGIRVVEKVTMVPVTNEAIEEQDPVETFRRQFGEGLFRIWPTNEMPPGEYAVVQYTEGKLSVQVWDFRIE